MGRLFLVECDMNPLVNYVHCRMCNTRVAFREHHVFKEERSTLGIYHKVFNVQVLDDEKYLRLDRGYTLADAYCVGCGMLLGWKLIGVPQQNVYAREGRFLMKLVKLINWNNDVPMNNEDQQGEGANEQVPNDQDGGANEQVPNDQDGGANEQVPNDQDGGAIEQVPNDQDGGAIEQVPNDQDGGANEQVPNDQDGGAIEQVANQDVDQLADGMGNID